MSWSIRSSYNLVAKKHLERVFTYFFSFFECVFDVFTGRFQPVLNSKKNEIISAEQLDEEFNGEFQNTLQIIAIFFKI